MDLSGMPPQGQQTLCSSCKCAYCIKHRTLHCLVLPQGPLLLLLCALLLLLQDLRPFDQALQVIMAIIIHLELFVTVKAVSDSFTRNNHPVTVFGPHPLSLTNTVQHAGCKLPIGLVLVHLQCILLTVGQQTAMVSLLTLCEVL